MAIIYKKFELGRLESSEGITALLRSDWDLLKALTELFNRHQGGDWGFATRDEAYANDLSVKNDEAIVSKHVLGGYEVIIATKGDRSSTMACLKGEVS